MVHAKGLSSPDFSLYGIWTIRTALEEAGPSDVAVEAASMWFIYAAPCIHRLCRAEKAFEGKVAKSGSLFRDREWRGFSVDRWKAWLDQMRRHSSSGSDGQAGKAVEEAMRAMNAV